jgi:hypothetical protein
VGGDGDQSSETDERASYESPTVTPFGDVRDILRGAQGSTEDAGFDLKHLGETE